jgi:hypothetical protein
MKEFSTQHIILQLQQNFYLKKNSFISLSIFNDSTWEEKISFSFVWSFSNKLSKIRIHINIPISFKKIGKIATGFS